MNHVDVFGTEGTGEHLEVKKPLLFRLTMCGSVDDGKEKSAVRDCSPKLVSSPLAMSHTPISTHFVDGTKCFHQGAEAK